MKPNIILINVDDLGYADIGCYGSKINKSPTIDAMARDGLLFTDFYSSSPVCTPSRAGLLTGCHPKRLDFQEFNVYDYHQKDKPKDKFVVLMPGQPEGLNPNEKTIANLLKEAGYNTKAIGKWHIGDQEIFSPLNFGFDSYFGLPYSNDMGLQTPRGIFKEMDYVICPLPLMKDKVVIEEQPDQAALIERYTYEAVDFIRENQNSPFFIYLAHTYVHHPLFVTDRFMKTANNNLMGAAIAAIDWSTNVIMYTLKRYGLENNTLIIFTSDNGGDLRSCNAPLRGYKGSTWEGGQRVNCIMKWPDVIKPSGVCHSITSNLDFYPTFADIIGISINDGVIRDGHSMLDLMKNPEAETKYEAFYYYARNELQAVRKGNYKLHLKTNELYDLSSDISESRNIYKDHPEIVSELEKLADKCREDIGDSLTGIRGKNCRQKGFEKIFKPLTSYDQENPYMIALYDLDSK